MTYLNIYNNRMSYILITLHKKHKKSSYFKAFQDVTCKNLVKSVYSLTLIN